MKRWWITALVLATIAAAGGGIILVTGVVPIAASAGHFAITEGFLQFAKRRSVATHSIGIELPALDDPGLVLKGAGQYESACRPCHGSPELRHPRIARAMLPPPPYLPEHISDWDPAELFYIVKHGIKFTGMPAWPSQLRDDEVQALVAFLLVFPSLDVNGYRRLVFGDEVTLASTIAQPGPSNDGATPAPRSALALCARCHGAAGAGRGLGAFPRLAGQRAEYLSNALEAYARDERQSGIMQPIAAALAPRELRALAEYYASLPGQPLAEVTARRLDPRTVERGRAIAKTGIPSDNVPSCADCHGPEPQRHNTAYPRIAGQYADYLALQLQLLRERRRGGSEYVHLMHKVVERLTAEQVREVAAYYASLPWRDSDAPR